MIKYKLLSIGELSKITGVHISSLRYYDKLGILKPAYIDPDTKYRYYSNSQIGMVEAIQACVEMDIPLKEYLSFTENEGHTIHVEQLLEHGKIQAQKKMRAIEAALLRIEQLQKEIEHSNELLNGTGSVICQLPQKRYFVVPMAAPMPDGDYVSLDRLHIVATEKGYSIGQELGLLYLYHGDTVERYQFIEVLSPAGKRDKNIMTIPAGKYIAKAMETDSIENAPQLFPAQFAQDYTKIVIETELFTGNADVEKPMFELKCSVTGM